MCRFNAKRSLHANIYKLTLFILALQLVAYKTFRLAAVTGKTLVSGKKLMKKLDIGARQRILKYLLLIYVQFLWLQIPLIHLSGKNY